MNNLPSSGDLFCEAIESSLSIEEPAETINVQLRIAESLCLIGDHDYARALLPGILFRVRALDDLRERGYLMRLFIELECNMDLLDDALDTLKLLDFDPEQRQAALKTLGAKLGASARFEESLQIADEIEDLDDYETVLENIGWRLAGEGRFAESFETARKIEPGEARGRLLRNIATEQWNDGQCGEAIKTLHEAARMAKEIDDENIRSAMLSATTNQFVELHQASEAIQIIPEIVDAVCRVKALVSIAVSLRQNGNSAGARSLFEEAAALSRTLDDVVHRAEALRDLGTTLAWIDGAESVTDIFRETLAAIKKIPNAYSRTEILAEFAVQLAALEQDESARRLFRLALEAAQEIETPLFRLERLARILEHQTSAAFSGDYHETFDMLEECFEEFVAKRLPLETGETILAVSLGEIACSLQCESERGDRNEADKQFQTALDRARKIVDPLNRTEAIRRLAEKRKNVEENFEKRNYREKTMET